ncbi:MAG TPA: hypothetical protein VHJ18_01275 [Streptosporangiaceae bacterium]|nr:hypothetical protein [Streptosporangiaceae bacterium]
MRVDSLLVNPSSASRTSLDVRSLREVGDRFARPQAKPQTGKQTWSSPNGQATHP